MSLIVVSHCDSKMNLRATHQCLGSSANTDEIPATQAEVVVMTFPLVCHTDTKLLLMLDQVIRKPASYKRIKGVKVLMKVQGADVISLFRSRLKIFFSIKSTLSLPPPSVKMLQAAVGNLSLPVHFFYPYIATVSLGL